MYVAELWSWPRTDDAALPGAAPLPLGAADADHGFHGGALCAPLRKQFVELGTGVHGGGTTLRPGSWLFAAVVAGGRLLVAGPGEQMEVHATQPLWARVHLPDSSAARAAECGRAPGLQVLLEVVIGGMWLWERPPRRPLDNGAAGHASGGSGCGSTPGRGGPRILSLVERSGPP